MSEIVLALRPQNDREMAMIVARFGGATLEDIGQEYGVSRERVRQLCERAGVTQEMLEDRPLFTHKRAMDLGEVFRQIDAAQAKRTARKARSRDFRRTARRRLVTALKALAQQLGRTPTLTELAADQGYQKHSLALATVHFATRIHGPRKTPYGTRSARLFRAAGLPPPQVGYNGHVEKVDWAARRREAVRMLRQAAGMVGGRPRLRTAAALFGLESQSDQQTSFVLPFLNGASREGVSIRWKTGVRRLYRAAGILSPYGSVRSLDQRHGAY